MVRRTSILAILPLLALMAVPSLVMALTPEEAARKVAETYGVEVLRVREVEDGGRRLYAVTVMLPGGNRNDAFQVGTLMVDADTGEPVPRLRHRASGYELPPPPTGSVPEPTADRLRERTFGRQ